MLVQDLSFVDPVQNLLYDDNLLRLAEQGACSEVLRFWESPAPFIVLGRTGVEAQDVDRVAVREDGVAVLRRSSGGGTVVQGAGCLNFALVLSKDSRPVLQSITQSYGFILNQVIKALSCLEIKAEFRPICDLVLAGTERKFSGNAQRRSRRFILHHGTILYNFDLALISRYLKMPVIMPDYRRARPHSDFVTNVPVSAQELKSALTQCFSEG